LIDRIAEVLHANIGETGLLPVIHERSEKEKGIAIEDDIRAPG